MPIILQDSQPKIYLGDYEMSVGGDVPVITTTTAAANLTGYEAGDTSLGNGFTITNDSGTIAVDSATVGGVTYNGLKIGGATTLQTKGNFGAMQTLEAEFIITALNSGDCRIISTGDNFDLSVYTTDSSNYLCYVADDYYQVLDPAVTRVPYTGGNCYDRSITKASLVDTVMNVKFVDNGSRVTMYVNDVAKVNWRSTNSVNTIFSTYGENFGANGANGNDMLITKLEWNGETLTWDGRTWVPA